MAAGDRIATYAAFWRFYLGEHAKPETRAAHYLGTSITLLCLIGLVATGSTWFLLGALIGGYGPAWIGHFIIEKNRPATFRHPIWSLISDFRMFAAWITGRLDRDLAAAGVSSRSRAGGRTSRPEA